RDFHDDETIPEDQIKKLLPKKPVKVGESWVLDAETIAKQLKQGLLFSLESEKAVGSGKLQRVYKQDNQQFGVLEFTIDAPVGAFGADKVDEGSRLTQKLTIEGCIDCSSGTVSNTIDVSTNISTALTEAGVKNGKLTVNMQLKGQLICKDLGKK